MPGVTEASLLLVHSETAFHVGPERFATSSSQPSMRNRLPAQGNMARMIRPAFCSLYIWLSHYLRACSMLPNAIA